jgi:hypothetical protein
MGKLPEGVCHCCSCCGWLGPCCFIKGVAGHDLGQILQELEAG